MCGPHQYLGPSLCALLQPPIASSPGPSCPLSSHTAPSSSYSITTHMLLLPPALAHCAISMVSWTPLSLPCLLQDLHSPGGPLPPHPFRLQLSPGSPLPAPPRGPLRACCLSSCCLSSLHIPVPMWAFFWEERNLSARQLPGEQEGASESTARRQKRARWSGGCWGQGPGRAGGCEVCGRQGAGAGWDGDWGLRGLGWRQRARSDGGGGM